MSTYVDPLPRLIDPRPAASTPASTRPSPRPAACRRPTNLQNIPIRTEVGRRIRAAFVAAPGKVLIGADYSQIELRVLAHLTDDPVLVAGVPTGEDIHTRTAAEVFDVPPALVTPEMRRRAKIINFGIIYGMGPQRLSRELAIPLPRRSATSRPTSPGYAGVRASSTTRSPRRAAKASSRRCSGAGATSRSSSSRDDSLRSFAERTAINTPVQGSAADLIKLAMVKLEARLTGSGSPPR